MLTIGTTRFSTVVNEFLKQYPLAVVKIDYHVPTESTITWCTNDKLRNAINFSLVENGNEILGFHDGPQNMWAAEETLPFVKTLADQKILRFRVSAHKEPSQWQKFLSRMFHC